MIKLSLLRPSFFRKWARSQVWLEYEYIGKHIVLGPVPYMYRSGFRLDDGERMDDRTVGLSRPTYPRSRRK
jgi:hypothetical protein